ncbi:hypothetical protein K435DRAFT_805410 [Dendrothele bispora CBS 962.96]|uniref:Uncharacterized protein n=1 Tax=Dendrothele bispora (strain CBS 962.96) TaxID=1314807 RepID=A0A4S8LBL4_DENBC|nr:hypothetical protein K435DRAFT_805410 [Dendrothele bispora CBS 962.96]
MERIWSLNFKSPNFDTRRFRLNRLGVFAGWRSSPTALTGLDFYLPQTDTYTGRIVTFTEDKLLDEDQIRLELYLWNSKQTPFYPGLSSIPVAKIPYQCSVDRSKGRFDPTKNPQLFDESHPYFPFIVRPQTAVNASRLPEDVPAFLIWESSPFPREELGYLLPDYYSTLMNRVWRLQTQIREIALDEASASWPNFRSSQPPKLAARNWGEEMTFNQLVDNLTPLQRWVKELDAWVRMGNLLRGTPRDPLLCLPFSDTTTADDSLLGIWANGMKELDLSWFWLHKVPVFVVHEVKGGKDEPSAIMTQRTSDPLLLTDWQDNKVCDEWMGLARRSRITVDENDWNQWIANSGTEDKAALCFWRSSSLATTENFPGQDTRSTIEVLEEISIPDEGKYGPKPVEMKILVQDRVSWIVPPKVADPNDRGSWEWFVEDADDEDNRCLRYVGRSVKKDLDPNDWPHTYFDRTRKRKIHLYTEIIIPPNLAHDTDVFGLPGPRIRYYNDAKMTPDAVILLQKVPSGDLATFKTPAKQAISFANGQVGATFAKVPVKDIIFAMTTTFAKALQTSLVHFCKTRGGYLRGTFAKVLQHRLKMTIRSYASDWVYKTEKPAQNDIDRSADAPDPNSLPKLPSKATRVNPRDGKMVQIWIIWCPGFLYRLA